MNKSMSFRMKFCFQTVPILNGLCYFFKAERNDVRILFFSGISGAKWTEGTSTKSIERDEQKKACQKITAFLRSAKNQKYIANVAGVPQARVPIVKFIHIKTALSVDLSFRNPMAVLNTDFIRLCVEADSRVRIVMISIRYWASRNGLSGGANRGSKFTNYALSMLIIFYLQV